MGRHAHFYRAGLNAPSLGFLVARREGDAARLPGTRAAGRTSGRNGETRLYHRYGLVSLQLDRAALMITSAASSGGVFSKMFSKA